MKTLILLLCLTPLTAFAQATVFGKWTTVDDATGEAKSIVEIYPVGDSLEGKIVELINPKPDTLKVCEKCPGKLKGQPIIGLVFMSKFKPEKGGQEWTRGEIIEPKTGKTYKCKMKLADGGKKLDVRGYIGFSLIGRTQTWLRAE